ncbi:MAG TPA: HAD family hydrolase [Gemmataceae bacterium]|nr:HAD family hydrolase [Gemmataceae bacterium]
MRVLLFDIDGTLIRSGGAGKAAMEAALKSAFGVAEVRDRVAYSGRTDPGIVRELLDLHGIEPADENATRLEAAYLAQLPGMLKRIRGSVLPGIDEALRRERQGAVVGLLTGNIRAGAEIKLRHYGLWDYFPFGGFADDLLDRDDVARRALAEAERHIGKRVDAADIWVIGDTPLDVQCARAIGAKAVVVATGWHPHEELLACNPDHLLPDFTHAGELLTQWGWI